MRIWSKLVLLGLLLCAMQPVAAGQLDAVHSQLTRGEYDAALSTLAALPEAQKGSEAARLFQADALIGKGDEKAAERVLQGVVRDYPAMPEGYNNLAALLVRQGKLDQARAMLEQALLTNERYATVYNNLLSVNEQIARNSYARALVLEKTSVQQLQLQRLSALNIPAATVPSEPGSSDMVVAMVEEPAPTPPKPQVESKPVAQKKDEIERRTAEKPAEQATEVIEEPATESVVAVVMEKEKAVSPVPDADKTPAAEGDQAVRDALSAWAAAWSAQDVEAYLEAYAGDYRPNSRISHKKWVAQRKVRLGKPAWIKVSLSEIEMKPRSDGSMAVTFIQAYSSESYGDVSRKRLIFRIHLGRWLIQSEKTLDILS